jgi:hypothetical protein
VLRSAGPEAPAIASESRGGWTEVRSEPSNLHRKFKETQHETFYISIRRSMDLHLVRA